MRLKTTTYPQGNENIARTSYPIDYSVRNFLLSHKRRGFSRDIVIPDDLIAEMEAFAFRNVITPIYQLPRKYQNPLNSTCKQCLKAHTIKKARKMGLDRKSIDFLLEVFDCELGHNGYYLDRNKLISLN